jgi:hypothetical protein
MFLSVADALAPTNVVSVEQALEQAAAAADEEEGEEAAAGEGGALPPKPAVIPHAHVGERAVIAVVVRAEDFSGQRVEMSAGDLGAKNLTCVHFESWERAPPDRPSVPPGGGPELVAARRRARRKSIEGKVAATAAQVEQAVGRARAETPAVARAAKAAADPGRSKRVAPMKMSKRARAAAARAAAEAGGPVRTHGPGPEYGEDDHIGGSAAPFLAASSGGSRAGSPSPEEQQEGTDAVPELPGPEAEPQQPLPVCRGAASDFLAATVATMELEAEGWDGCWDQIEDWQARRQARAKLDQALAESRASSRAGSRRSSRASVRSSVSGTSTRVGSGSLSTLGGGGGGGSRSDDESDDYGDEGNDNDTFTKACPFLDLPQSGAHKAPARPLSRGADLGDGEEEEVEWEEPLPCDMQLELDIVPHTLLPSLPFPEVYQMGTKVSLNTPLRTAPEEKAEGTNEKLMEYFDKANAARTKANADARKAERAQLKNAGQMAEIEAAKSAAEAAAQRSKATQGATIIGVTIRLSCEGTLPHKGCTLAMVEDAFPALSPVTWDCPRIVPRRPDAGAGAAAAAAAEPKVEGPGSKLVGSDVQASKNDNENENEAKQEAEKVTAKATEPENAGNADEEMDAEWKVLHRLDATVLDVGAKQRSLQTLVEGGRKPQRVGIDRTFDLFGNERLRFIPAPKQKVVSEAQLAVLAEGGQLQLPTEQELQRERDAVKRAGAVKAVTEPFTQVEAALGKLPHGRLWAMDRQLLYSPAQVVAARRRLVQECARDEAVKRADRWRQDETICARRRFEDERDGDTPGGKKGGGKRAETVTPQEKLKARRDKRKLQEAEQQRQRVLGEAPKEAADGNLEAGSRGIDGDREQLLAGAGWSEAKRGQLLRNDGGNVIDDGEEREVQEQEAAIAAGKALPGGGREGEPRKQKLRRRQQEDAKLASSRAYIDQVDAVNRVWRGTLSMLYPRITALTVRWDNAAGNVTMDVPCAGAKPGFMRAYLADASHEFAAQVRYRSGQRLRLFCTVAARSAAEEAGNPGGGGGGGGGGEHTVTSAEMAMSIASKSQRTAVVDREPKQGGAAKAKPQPKGGAQDKAARRSSGSGGNGAAQRAAEAQVNSLRAHVPCWRTCVVQPRADDHLGSMHAVVFDDAPPSVASALFASTVSSHQHHATAEPQTLVADKDGVAAGAVGHGAPQVFDLNNANHCAALMSDAALRAQRTRYRCRVRSAAACSAQPPRRRAGPASAARETLSGAAVNLRSLQWRLLRMRPGGLSEGHRMHPGRGGSDDEEDGGGDGAKATGANKAAAGKAAGAAATETEQQRADGERFALRALPVERWEVRAALHGRTLHGAAVHDGSSAYGRYRPKHVHRLHADAHNVRQQHWWWRGDEADVGDELLRLHDILAALQVCTCLHLSPYLPPTPACHACTRARVSFLHFCACTCAVRSLLYPTPGALVPGALRRRPRARHAAAGLHRTAGRRQACAAPPPGAGAGGRLGPARRLQQRGVRATAGGQARAPHGGRGAGRRGGGGRGGRRRRLVWGRERG